MEVETMIFLVLPIVDLNIFQQQLIFVLHHIFLTISLCYPKIHKSNKDQKFLQDLLVLDSFLHVLILSLRLTKSMVDEKRKLTVNPKC